MVVISYSTLKDFFKKHNDAEDALNNWYRTILRLDCANFHQLKQFFKSVDAVGNDRYVFNIRGNAYRLVALIKFKTRTIYVRYIGTHAAYDKIKDCSVM